MKMDKNSFIIGIILGMVLSAMAVSLSPLHAVYESNIGGFVFRDGKAYQLTELSNEPFTAPQKGKL